MALVTTDASDALAKIEAVIAADGAIDLTPSPQLHFGLPLTDPRFVQDKEYAVNRAKTRSVGAREPAGAYHVDTVELRFAWELPTGNDTPDQRAARAAAHAMERSVIDALTSDFVAGLDLVYKTTRELPVLGQHNGDLGYLLFVLEFDCERRLSVEDWS